MKIIACHSNKGGVGKTATAVNLAYALAASGRSTLLCDLDPQGAATFYFRVKPAHRLTEKRFFGSARRVAEAIKGSDYDGLDILPATLAHRNFDTFLADRGKSRLRKILHTVGREYDVVLLDCPPSLSSLAENVFRAADAVIVPIIPATLSQRSFVQLRDFVQGIDGEPIRLHGFFSMVQRGKLLHRTVMEEMRAAHGGLMLETAIPFAADVERMGLIRGPLTAINPGSRSAKNFVTLLTELLERIAPGPTG